MRGLVAALGQASGVLINIMRTDCVAVPSVSITNGKETRVIVGGDDSVIDAAVAKNILFGAYDNVLSTVGVAPLLKSLDEICVTAPVASFFLTLPYPITTTSSIP